MLHTALALAILINLSFSTSVLSADLPITPPAGGEQDQLAPVPPRPKPVSDPNLNPYNPEDPTCRAWTDGCRNCQRDGAGNVHCSNIGIACQPGAITCQ